MVPEALIDERVMTITGTDGRKMSKSYDNIVPILSPSDDLRRAVMSIVTDSRAPSDRKDPDGCNVFNLYRHVAPAARRRRNGGALPRRRHRLPRGKGSTLSTRSSSSSARHAPATTTLMYDVQQIDAVLERGAERARARARPVLNAAREAVGLGA